MGPLRIWLCYGMFAQFGPPFRYEIVQLVQFQVFVATIHATASIHSGDLTCHTLQFTDTAALCVADVC